MGLACRRFLLDRDDTLWGLSTTKFERMLRDPAKHCLPVLAGQRVRMADVIVELMDREPVRVVRSTFPILTFDADGRLDPGRFEEQQSALVESLIAPVIAGSHFDRSQTVVNATARFVAQGGHWVPSRALSRIIDETALGQRPCPRL